MWKGYGILLTNKTDTLDEAGLMASEAIADAGEEVNAVWDVFQDRIPDLLAFGIRVLLCFVFFLIGRIFIKWICRFVRRSMERANADKGAMQFIDSLLKFLLYAILLFTIAIRLGVESSSVAALLASVGVAIGLALQGSLSNFAGGVLILLLKPFVVGDYIIEDMNKNEGTVKEIQIFYTKLTTLDNKTIVIPNGTLANTSLTNVTARPERQLELKISISYQADLKEAKRLLEDLILNNPAIIQEEEHKVFVDDLAESAVVLGLRAWVRTDEYWKVRWQLLEDIKLTLDEHGIEIPFNQITVHMAGARSNE